MLCFRLFLDRYRRTKDPYAAIRPASVFASYEIGEKEAAQGFLTGPELDEWVRRAAAQKE